MQCRLSRGEPAGQSVVGSAGSVFRASFEAAAMCVAPLIAARRHGAIPSISISREKLSTVRMITIRPSTATFSRVGSIGDRVDQIRGHQDLQPEQQHTADRPAQRRRHCVAAAGSPDPDRQHRRPDQAQIKYRRLRRSRNRGRLFHHLGEMHSSSPAPVLAAEIVDNSAGIAVVVRVMTHLSILARFDQIGR